MATLDDLINDFGASCQKIDGYLGIERCRAARKALTEHFAAARAVAHAEAIEKACSLVASKVEQYGAALTALRALAPAATTKEPK